MILNSDFGKAWKKELVAASTESLYLTGRSEENYGKNPAGFGPRFELVTSRMGYIK
jgi:hypothetical protein